MCVIGGWHTPPAELNRAILERSGARLQYARAKLWRYRHGIHELDTPPGACLRQ
jgi:hypothetical protein